MKKSFLAILLIVGITHASQFDLGVGYIKSSFDATQKIDKMPFNKTSGSGNGIEFFINKNFYPTERFGFLVGFETEFSHIKWSKELVGLESSDDTATFESFKSDVLISLGLNAGLFVDVYQSEKFDLRLFGTGGIAWISTFNKSYGGWNCAQSYHYIYGYSNSVECQSPHGLYGAYAVPMNLGVQFIFEKHHALELATQIDLQEMEFNNNIVNSTYKTTFARKSSFLLRYVYKYKQKKNAWLDD